jgi:hypothetical protein
VPPEGVDYPLSQLLGFTKSLGSGPDMAGWAMIPVATHIEEARTLAVGEGKTGLELIEEFKTALISKQFNATWNNPMLGEIRTNTNKTEDDGISYTMSNACVIMGAMALVNAGHDEFDLRTNDAWKKRSTNMTGGAYVYASPADALYKQEILNKTTFNTQISIAFGDMFFGDSVYRRVAVQAEDLTALAAEAAAVIGNAAAYTDGSFAAFTAAYQTALGFINGGTVTDGFGKAFFTLRDAYDNLKPAGSVSVRVLGAEDVLYGTEFVTASGSVLDVLGQYAADFQVSQTATTSAVQEIVGLKGEWRVYNGEARVTDLTVPLGEGAALTFKYTANQSVVPETATLDEQLVRETAATLTIATTVTENISLPSSGAFGTTITWQSSNPLYLSASGVVRRAAGDVAGTLTATVSGPRGTSLALPFSVVLKGTNPSETQKQYAWISVTDPNPPAGRPGVYYAKQRLEIEPGETAYTILQKTGLTLRTNLNTQYGVYVEAIEGYGEFDGGPNSGWVCKVNGVGITKSSALIPLNDGDTVEWLYTRDLGKDVGISWEGSNNPSGEPATINPKVTVTGGVAAVTVSASDITAAIAKLKENGGAAIIITPENTGSDPTEVTVSIPLDSLTAVATQTDAALTIQTPVGTVTFPNAALDSIASKASGSTVTISLGTVDKTTLTTDQQKAVGTSTVFDIAVLSGNTHITSFSGSSLSISLPYTLKEGESASGVTIWYLSDDGKLERMTCTYDMKTGLATFTTTHLSNYVVGYDAWENPFTDVKSGDWFYDAVRYTTQNELFNGTSATTFAPNNDMTRAMLVTVLYRLEGKPAVTGANAFSDVKSGEWYTDAVIWATENGIVNGYGNNLFGTNDPITREQMATMLLRYAEYKKYDTAKANDLASFTDANSIASYALAAMKWANAEGLITGRTATTLAPTGTATRAEVATILMRFAENVVKYISRPNPK